MPEKYTVIAQQGGGRYLVAQPGNVRGYVYTKPTDSLSKEINVNSLLARGYWEFTEHPDVEVEKIIDDLLNVDLDAEASAFETLTGESSPSSLRDAINAARKVLKYSPDQPRDSHGRFGSGGGGGNDDGKLEDGNAEPTGKRFSGFEYTKNDSLFKHLTRNETGGFDVSPERLKLHQQIISKFLDGVPKSSNPTMYMLGGGPAAGKSTATKNPDMGIPGHDQAVFVDADAIKKMLPEYQQMVDAENKNAASFCHEESSMLSKQIMAEAIRQGKDIVLDGTGNSSRESVLGKIGKAQDAGYQVIGTYVTCPTDVAIERNRARAAEGGSDAGRFVPESVVAGVHASVSAVVPDIASQFDSFRLIDSTLKGPSGEDGQVIATATKGQPITILNDAAWQSFLDKAKG